jgi:hypothetical protein
MANYAVFCVTEDSPFQYPNTYQVLMICACILRGRGFDEMNEE